MTTAFLIDLFKHGPLSVRSVDIFFDPLWISPDSPFNYLVKNVDAMLPVRLDGRKNVPMSGTNPHLSAPELGQI